MYKRPLVPAGFAVPAGFRHKEFVARMLSVRDLIADYDAVMCTEKELVGVMEPDSAWPRGLTLEEDLIDLGWHQREFTLRHSFAYTVMAPDESLCLGCCYINPSDLPGFEPTIWLDGQWVEAANYRYVEAADLAAARTAYEGYLDLVSFQSAPPSANFETELAEAMWPADVLPSPARTVAAVGSRNLPAWFPIRAVPIPAFAT